MRFSTIFFILILSACSNGTLQKGSIDPYSSSGFALIYNEEDYNQKIISSKLSNNELEIAHKFIKKNSIIKLQIRKTKNQLN